MRPVRRARADSLPQREARNSLRSFGAPAGFGPLQSLTPFTAPFSEVRPRRAPLAPLLRRCARGRRFPRNRATRSRPKTPPRVHLTAAPLPLRRLPSPAGISSRFCSPQNERNPFLCGRATCRVLFCSLLARLRRFILFRLIAERVESPLKASAHGAFQPSPAGISSRFCCRKTSEIPLLAGGRRESFEPDRTALAPGGRCVPHSQLPASTLTIGLPCAGGGQPGPT